MLTNFDRPSHPNFGVTIHFDQGTVDKIDKLRAEIHVSRSAYLRSLVTAALQLGIKPDIVPESTECWQIPGFKEAVDLMDDPPDDMPDIEEE